MVRHPVKVLVPADLRRLLRHVQSTRHPQRNRALVLPSFKAGLRACEIAGLSWPMALAGNGKLGDGLAISKHIAKMGHGKRIPLHPDLSASLHALHVQQGRPRTGLCKISKSSQTREGFVTEFGPANLGCGQGRGPGQKRHGVTAAASVANRVRYAPSFTAAYIGAM